MRFLGEVRKETNVPIWPFDTTGVPIDSTVVEIYPRLFLHSAGIGGGGQPTPDTVAKLRKCYQATLQDAPVKWTGDERDALISAAGMGWFVRQPSVWEGPTAAARYEGWMLRRAEEGGLMLRADWRASLCPDPSGTFKRSDRHVWRVGAKDRPIPEGAKIHRSTLQRKANPDNRYGPDSLPESYVEVE